MKNCDTRRDYEKMTASSAFSKRSKYSLTPVHSNSYGSSSVSQLYGSTSSSSTSYYFSPSSQEGLVMERKPKLGLGVNAQTGRLQWCPGFTCCKLLIVIPVIMLPITLVLILLMRMDGMLMALQLHQQQQQLRFQSHHLSYPDPLYIEDYDTTGDGGDGGADFAIDNNPLQEIINEQLLLTSPASSSFSSSRSSASSLARRAQNQSPAELSDLEKIKRCIAPIFDLNENIEIEDRDIMKDSRTSFLPRETTIIPRECLQNLGLADMPDVNYNNFDLNAFLETFSRAKRLKRDKEIQPDVLKQEPDATKAKSNSDSSSMPSEEAIAALKSFWNAQGNKQSIRDAQSRTMLKYIDSSVEPCDDFYQYACGNWEKHHPIPRDKAGFDTFEMLRENLDVVLKELLETDALEEEQQQQGMHKKPIQHIDSNNFDTHHPPNTEADIVKSYQQPEQEQLQKQKIREHIIQKRQTLNEILRRFRRNTLFTNTKRKRFSSNGTAEIQLPEQRRQHLKPTNSYSTQHAQHLDAKDAHTKARHLYQSCNNVQLLEQRGIQPLLKLIEDLGGWPVLDDNWNAQQFDWLNLTARLRRYNNDILIVQWVGPDIQNSDENVIQFDQTNLGLPTREYFLQEVNSKYLQAYQRFMFEVMNKLGASKAMATKTAQEIIKFETQLAAITAPAEKRLNVTKLYKRMSLIELHKLVPDIDWMRYLSVLQQRDVLETEDVVIYAMEYMQDLVNLLAETESKTVANYLMWRFIRHRTNNVDERFDDIKQTFYHALFGREESPSRWKFCISQVNTNMGMALGSMFVRKYFDENSKQDTMRMTHELQRAFREILLTTNWLDNETKNLAELKVNAMSLKIGYPDFILNAEELNEKYAGIEIDPERYFENTLNVLLHTTKMEQNKLSEAVNKTSWQTAPAIVNAYYSRNKNQIMFPAGILQPPFYHRHFPRALNFGGIGVVIGHELTHGFDDKGRLFDRNGSIHKWWTDVSIKGFDERARCIIAQYGNYTVGEVGIALNGESTQGENIADNGGIRQAFHAYKKWLDENPEEAADEYLPGIDMTGEQLFFLNFGQVWCGAMRPEAVRNKLNTAIHSPGRFRVIGTLSNSLDFAKEFQCPLGSRMNPVRKCSVW